jgi:uncharacterized protein (DUF1330 family)
VNEIVEQYLATWNADDVERARLLAEHWSADVRYVDPMADVTGTRALGALIDAVHAQCPGWVFRRTSDVDAHHQQLRFSWGLGPVGETPSVTGFDVVLLDENGRITDVRGFLDTMPSASDAPGYALGQLWSVEFGPEIRRYMEDIEATFEPFGGGWLVHGASPEVVEGPWSADVVIIGFPSLAAAREWYTSPAYQEILELRTEHSESRVVLLEGVPHGYRAADTLAKVDQRLSRQR